MSQTTSEYSQTKHIFCNKGCLVSILCYTDLVQQQIQDISFSQNNFSMITIVTADPLILISQKPLLFLKKQLEKKMEVQFGSQKL